MAILICLGKCGDAPGAKASTAHDRSLSIEKSPMRCEDFSTKVQSEDSFDVVYGCRKGAESLQ